MNKLQLNALKMIKSDARFIYNITLIKDLNSNYICMSLPYIGLFVDGAKQWGEKVGLEVPQFNYNEKEFYTALRNSHKLFEMKCSDFETELLSTLKNSDEYFHRNRTLRSKITGVYFNVGTDKCNDEFCGNTILCAMYMPFDPLNKLNVGPYFRDMSIITGKIAAYYECLNQEKIELNLNNNIKYEDYHLFDISPLKMNNSSGFVLFSILCTINYVTEFIEHFFIGELAQKFKFAYLQYYYLCEFLDDFNRKYNTKLVLNKKLYSRKFRNCIAHYGIGQFINEEELIEDDVLLGLTNKAFGMNYGNTKKELYTFLNDVKEQIKELIF